jgi:hypothetical protein
MTGLKILPALFIAFWPSGTVSVTRASFSP